MSRILLNLIHERATLARNPNITITAQNYHLWVKHWFQTAENLAVSFDTEGLHGTAKAVRDLIEQERRYYP